MSAKFTILPISEALSDSSTATKSALPTYGEVNNMDLADVLQSSQEGRPAREPLESCHLVLATTICAAADKVQSLGSDSTTTPFTRHALMYGENDDGGIG